MTFRQNIATLTRALEAAQRRHAAALDVQKKAATCLAEIRAKLAAALGLPDGVATAPVKPQTGDTKLNRILDFLREATGPKRAQEIAAKIGSDYANTNALLHLLLKRGTIKRPARGLFSIA